MSRGDDDAPPLVARALSRVTENWSLKLVSVVISVVLYVVLHSGGDSQRTIDVDLIAAPPRDTNRVLLTPLPPRVHVTVLGPRTLLDELPNTIEPLTVDLTREPTSVRFEDVPLKLPIGLRKIHVVPPYLALRWDTRVSKRLPVEPVWNAPAEGLRLKSITVDPSTLGATGPRSHVDLVQKLRTNALDLGHRTAGTHTQSLLIDVVSDPALSDVHLETDTVEAKFELVLETRTRTFTGLPVIALKARSVTLRPRNVSVVVTCPPRRAEELTPESLVPKLDLEALGADFAKKGPEEADVRVDIPGCTDVTVSPPRITVTR